MKIDRKRKIEKVAHKTEPSFQNLIYRDGTLMACNGKSAVIITVEKQEGDIDGSIPIAAIKNSKGDSAQLSFKEDRVTTLDGTSYIRPFVRMPDIADAVPRGEPKAVIRFSSKLLRELAQALGTDYVELTVYEHSDPFKVRALREEDQGTFGILMPAI